MKHAVIVKRLKMKKNSGFGLIEVLITVGILGGLALVGMQLTKNQTKSTVKNTFDSEVQLINSEINEILSDPERCLTTLGGKNAVDEINCTPSINGKFKSISGGATAEVYGNANVSIKKYDLAATTTEVAANESYLIINYQNKNILKGTSGAETIKKRIPLFVKVDAANKITECRSLASKTTDIWTRGNNADIYYNGGSVGIGNSSPSSLLDVAGDIRPGNQTQAANCSSQNEGALRYNSLKKTMEFCNGSMWSLMGLRMESGEGLVADTCVGGSVNYYENSFFCDGGVPARTITFNLPFTTPPKIIVTLAGPSADASLLPCTGGAMDQVGTNFDSVTVNSFRAMAWMSPFGTSCGSWANYSGPIKFNWYAIGN